MTRKITMELSLEDQQAVRAWQRSKSSITSYLDEAGKIEGKNKRNTKSSQDFFRSSVRSMGQAASAFVGVGTAVSGIATVAGLLRAEYDNLLERQQNSANALKGRAALEAELITNSTTATELGATPVERGRNILHLRDVFSETLGISQTNFTPVASQAASSRGNLDLPTAFKVAGLSYLTAGGDPNTAKARTSLGLGLAQGGVPFDSGIGFGIAAGQSLPISNSEQIASALGKTIPAGLATGATAPETTGLFAAFAGATNDTEGKRSGTATLQFEAILDKLAPNIDRIEDQIQFIRNNPKKFADQTELSKLPGETAFKPLFQSLLRDGNEVGDRLFSRFKTVRDDLPTLDKAGQTGRDAIEALSASDAINVEALDSRFKQLTENAESRDVAGARKSVTREGLQALMKAEGFSAFTQKTAGIGFDAAVELGGVDPVDAASSFLSKKASQLRRPYDYRSAGIGAAPVRIPRTPTDEERQQATSLQRAANLLNNDSILDKLDKLIEVTIKKPVAQAPLSKREDVRTPATDPRSTALMN